MNPFLVTHSWGHGSLNFVVQQQPTNLSLFSILCLIMLTDHGFELKGHGKSEPRYLVLSFSSFELFGVVSKLWLCTWLSRRIEGKSDAKSASATVGLLVFAVMALWKVSFGAAGFEGL